MTRREFIVGSGLGIAGSLFASPVRSIVASQNMSFKGETAQQYSVEDYVQDGLVGCLDAIENIGLRQHDSTSGKWVELVSGVEVQPIGTGVTFSENRAFFDGTGAIMSETNLTPRITDFTVEVVISDYVSNGGTIFASCMRQTAYNLSLKLDGSTALNWGIANFAGTVVAKPPPNTGTMALTADGTLYNGYYNGGFYGSRSLSPNREIMTG